LEAFAADSESTARFEREAKVLLASWNHSNVAALRTGKIEQPAGDGALVFTRGDVLMGAPFDASNLKGTGPAVPLIEGVTRDKWFGAADYALSSAGALIYLTGGVATEFRLPDCWRAGS
jgi:hypothetical protein